MNPGSSAPPGSAVTAPRTTGSGDAASAIRSLERARLAASMDKWPTALHLVRATLAVLPDDPAALSLYGLALARSGGDLADAIDACRRAVESQPDAAAWHAHLGEAYRIAGLLPQAAACYRAALALDPQEPLAARALALRGRTARWRAWFARVTQRRATPPPA